MTFSSSSASSSSSSSSLSSTIASSSFSSSFSSASSSASSSSSSFFAFGFRPRFFGSTWTATGTAAAVCALTRALLRVVVAGAAAAAGGSASEAARPRFFGGIFVFRFVQLNHRKLIEAARADPLRRIRGGKALLTGFKSHTVLLTFLRCGGTVQYPPNRAGIAKNQRKRVGVRIRLC
ncbi:hypothetical protein BDR26DRAFT_232720 [Obelidium mucronatum]|nr:hypothetical protein BDR26DRAFT_232720 [Obelidium mucronatum]